MNTSINHRFNRKDMAWLHKTCGFIASVMWYIRSTMKKTTDSMPTVGSVNCQPKLCYFYPFYYMNLEITFPISRYIVPGLQIQIAFCKHSQALVTKNLLDQATYPTRYVQLRSTCTPSLYTVTSKLTISPFSKGLSSGIPWQITQLTEVQRDLGNLQQFSGDGKALFSIIKLWTTQSIQSVVTPALTTE